MATKNSENNVQEYMCEICDYKCKKKQHLTQHFNTIKHKTLFGNIVSITTEHVKPITYDCACGKIYKDRTGLWKHRKKCKDYIKYDNEKEEENLIISLIMEVMKNNNELQKQNDEFKTLMIEQNSKLIDVYKNNTTSINNSMINSNNKTFNLQVFLNEQCKDAMNIMDFVDSIKLDLNDLESVGKLGYINGISNIIIKKLNALDVHMRPVHCTDLKRETMYVKSQNVWEKEDEENKNIRRAIKHVAFKNIKNLELFKELHPDCLEYDSKHGDHYLKLQIEALGGGSSNVEYDSQTKIIKKIAKEVTIDKTPN